LSNGAGSSVDGGVLAEALVSGIHRVIGQQEYLNRINVFPVADSDTGTNLCLSLTAGLGVLRNRYNEHVGKLLTAMADALLDGARGNSGAILAQFFQGMSDSAGDLTRFTTGTFSKAITKGSEYAHDALSQPREGTILSVIAAFANSIRLEVSADPDGEFASILRKARQAVDVALADTPKQLEVLRKAGVVDAGAKGFAELIGGLADYLVEGLVTPMPEAALVGDIRPAVAFSAADNTSRFRYCTECLVTADDIPRRKLREALADLGDSLVLAGSKRKAKIHIHVDDPNAVFRVSQEFGELSGEKADDMHRQQHATHSMSKTFAVITDSGADITDDDMERLDIHMVPCRIQFGDRGYLDKVSVTTEEFYHELENNPHHPTTSQPAPGDFRRQFQFLASHYSDVLSINLTSRASGTYEGARTAAKRCDGPGRIHVLDSLNASVGQGQLVVLAAECAAAGMGIKEALRIVRNQVPHTHTFALLNDLRFAVRGGRLPRWVKVLAEIARLTPVVSIKPDGRVALDGLLLGRRNQVPKFARYVARRLKTGGAVEISIGQALCPDDAQRLAAELRRRVPGIDKLKICGLGTALGVHGGPGTLIVSSRPVTLEDSLAVGDD
jgi:hypothetical protein